MVHPKCHLLLLQLKYIPNATSILTERDGMGWDGMGWDGMGWDGMGWRAA